MKLALAALFTALALTGCGGGGGGAGDLATRDPQGSTACTALAEAFKNKDNTEKAIAKSLESGGAALTSTTPAIKEAVIDLAGATAADPGKMVTACRAEGVTMPDVPG